MSEMNGLEQAIARAGSQSALARLIGKKQGHIWAWLNREGGKVPAEVVVDIERVTGIPRQRLRPDLYEGMEGVNGDGETAA